MKVPVQPVVNVGVVGHVDHGKTALVRAITGESTDRHSEEIKRGISIRLGSADAAVYKCPACEPPQNYGTSEMCKHCGGKAEFQRAISFVDSPGHETLMATMLSGAAIMNGALLLIAANEKCPQPQTKEHLMALSIIGVDKIIIVQNKVDIVSEEEAKANHQEIEAFVSGTVAEKAPIITVSAHHDVNIDAIFSAIEHIIKTPEYDEKKPARMHAARSFDVNKPGIGPDKFVGGVIGGSLTQGRLKVGEEIEIVPGRQTGSGAAATWHKFTSKVRTLHTGGSSRKEVGPGGLVAIGTYLDPALTKSDSLVGRLLGHPGTLPEPVHRMTAEVDLLEKVVGAAEDMKVDGVKTSEPLMLSVGTATTVGMVTSARGNVAEMNLKIPVAAEPGQRLAISRRIGGKWRLIGHGLMK